MSPGRCFRRISLPGIAVHCAVHDLRIIVSYPAHPLLEKSTVSAACPFLPIPQHSTLDTTRAPQVANTCYHTRCHTLNLDTQHRPRSDYTVPEHNSSLATRDLVQEQLCIPDPACYPPLRYTWRTSCRAISKRLIRLFLSAHPRDYPRKGDRHVLIMLAPLDTQARAGLYNVNSREAVHSLPEIPLP